MTSDHRYLVHVLLYAIMWASPSCDLDTETELCLAGTRCPTGWRCAANQDVCIDSGCGDGIADLRAGEACDDGNIIDGDDCSADCKSLASCGNGFFDPGEICDDYNNVSGDGCSADCLSNETCGNGYRDLDEFCDDGNTVSGDGCSADCGELETCGNGSRDYGELCDDGNQISGDGCSSDCLSIEICGNGYTDFDEQCDEGQPDSATCDADCTFPLCGDAYHNPEFINPANGEPEQCDDGNDTPGDGCNNCILE